jgi:hypothetical protein
MARKKSYWKHEFEILDAFVDKYPECLRKITVEKITPTGQRRYKDWYIYTNKKGEEEVVYFSNFSNDFGKPDENGKSYSIATHLFDISHYLYPDIYDDLILTNDEFDKYIPSTRIIEIKHPNNFTKYVSYDDFNSIRFGWIRKVFAKRNEKREIQ